MGKDNGMVRGRTSEQHRAAAQQGKEKKKKVPRFLFSFLSFFFSFLFSFLFF